MGPTTSTPDRAQLTAVRVEQVGRAVQADRGLARARGALHADRLGERARTMSSWSGWMVATMSRIGPLRGRSISAAQERALVVLGVGEALVLEAGQLAVGEAEPAAPGPRPGDRGAGLVERPAHRRAPVDHHRVARRVADVPAADVEGLGKGRGQGVGTAEEGRHPRIGGQRAQAPGPCGTEPLGAQASTPASTMAEAAVRISVRQSAARARWSRSAARTGSRGVSGAAG